MTIELEAVVAEQTRARYPDTSGYVERDGVKLYYEVYGTGEPTVLLLPTWSIIHSRHWKMQIPYLARHCRVVTFDGRGNGRSDRPPSGYEEREFAADALAVLDATETESAMLVSLSLGAPARAAPGGRASRARRRSGLHRPLGAVRRAGRGSPAPLVEQGAGHGRGLGEVQPPLLAPRLPRLPAVLLLADVHGAALDEADRGLRRLGARDHPGDAHRDAAQGDARRGHPARPLSPPFLPGPRDPGDGRCDLRPGSGDRPRRGDRRRARPARGVGARPSRPRPGQGQPAAARLREATAAVAPLGTWQVAPQACALRLLADRARPRAARCCDRRRAAQAPSRPPDRLARPASGDGGAGGARGAHPSRQRPPRQRVRPYRERVGRARPALLPRDPADGRDPALELHGLPRPRPRRPVRPLDRRRGLGARLLPAREPRAEAGCLCAG